MPAAVGVRELRQNLSKYLDRVKAGETLSVTERGNEVALLVPTASAGYIEAAIRFGATIPTRRIEDVVKDLPGKPLPAGTTDAYIEETRRDRFE